MSASKPAGRRMPCDPGAGFPAPKVGCVDPVPATGWLTAGSGGLSLSPFRTLRNDAAGAAYAREHGEEYPFAHDYLDAPAGAARALRLEPGTVCTGIIVVGYRQPLKDRVVSCEALAGVAERRHVPVAVWRSADGDVLQASELYRP